MLHLLVGIDTESDNQWDVSARERPTFENIKALPKLHTLLRRHGVRPTYVATYPVARHASSAAVLRELCLERNCEIGAHHHAWETPPCAPEEARQHPYALGLTIERFESQLGCLTDAVEEAVGDRPVSYRSGRFGFSAAHVSALERAGYRVESSVAPLFNEAYKGGPDFVGAPLGPYFLAYDDVTRSGTSNLLEVPVSAGLSRPVPALLERVYARALRPYATRRLLRVLRLARVVWLRPSYSSLEDMKTLARRIASGGASVLNVIFHSSEAIVGGSPYNRTDAELRCFFDRLERFLVFATEELGACPVTFREFRTRFCAVPGS